MDTENLMGKASEALKKIALNEEVKSHVIKNPLLYKLMRRAADRYIAGEELSQAVAKVRECNRLGLSCTVDFMGESVRSEEEANAVTDEFVRLAESIRRENLNSTISLDLSHIGLLANKKLGLDNLVRILKTGIEVVVSAEGTDRTDEVIELYTNAAKGFPNIGITLQVYLHRTEEDLKKLIKLPGKIRLVKGAFETSLNEALPRGRKLDDKYISLLKLLLQSNHKCSIATHDPVIQKRALQTLSDIKSVSEYEFESLLGINTEQLHSIARSHPARVYVVYGKEWFLYLCNRLAEYPPAIFQAITEIIEPNN